MPQAFDITTTTPSVKLSSSGEGELAFTVSNAMRRAVRGRIVAQPEGKTEASWLSIKGAAEVDFAADGTHQVMVKIKAPAGTPEGTYGCHLLVSSVANPDEEYTTGPTVSFAVSSVSPTKPFPWWIVALVAGVLVLGGGAVALVFAMKGPGLNDSCDPAANKCPKEMTCVADRRVCLAVEGGACDRGEDCETGRCDAGKCASPLPGAACKAADGSCPAAQECTTKADSSKVCLLSLDQACTQGQDCVTGRCDEGKCAYSLPGAACQADTNCPPTQQCATDTATSKVCLVRQDQACTQSRDCVTKLCEGNKCVVPPPGANCQADGDCPSTQRCVEVTAGSKSCLLRPTQACTKDLDCSSFWCLPDQKVCSRDDGRCQSNSECRPPNFACTSGSCRKVDTLACAGDAECVSGFCDGVCKTSPPCVPACNATQYCSRGQCRQRIYVVPSTPIFRIVEPVQPSRIIPITPRIIAPQTIPSIGGSTSAPRPLPR